MFRLAQKRSQSHREPLESEADEHKLLNLIGALINNGIVANQKVNKL